MTVRWLLLGASAIPEGDGWLGAEERKVLAGLRFPKRRSEWRLGRYAAKRALSAFVGVDALDRIQVIAAEDGAPEAYVDGTKLDSGISISHREGRAACAIAPGAQLGCDLEAVEPRTPRFVKDFFTERERVEVEKAAASDRDRLVALTWSAKESALKALRVGLRRDTRSVEVEIDVLETTEPGWHPLRARVSPEGRTFEGCWREEEGFVLTVVLP
jgi:4'-phosphopantetheinyl transferase